VKGEDFEKTGEGIFGAIQQAKETGGEFPLTAAGARCRRSRDAGVLLQTK